MLDGEGLSPGPRGLAPHTAEGKTPCHHSQMLTDSKFSTHSWHFRMLRNEHHILGVRKEGERRGGGAFSIW